MNNYGDAGVKGKGPKREKKDGEVVALHACQGSELTVHGGHGWTSPLLLWPAFLSRKDGLE